MKRFFILCVALLPSLTLSQAVHLRPWGIATTIDFVLFDASNGTLDVDEVDGGAEVVLFCDEEDADGTVATNDFVDESNFYSIALTAAEMQCARLVIDIGASDRNIVIVETYGHPSSQHPQL